MLNGVSTSNGSGTVTYTATGNVALSVIDSVSGAINVTADSGAANTGAITDNTAAETANLDTTGTVTLSAAAGIGSAGGVADIDTTIGTLIATNDTTGNIFIQETNGLVVDGTGVRTLAGSGNVNIDVDAGNLTINTVINAHGSGTIVVNVDAGDITMAAAASSTSGSGNISYAAAGDVNLGLLTTTGGVLVIADSDNNNTGAITDNNAGVNNVVGTSSILQAATGIGSAGSLEIVVSNLAASNTTSGNINLDDLQTTGLTVTSVTLFTTTVAGVTNSGAGQVNLTNTGTIAINSAVSSGGNVNITALDAGSVGRSVTIPASVTSNAGNVTLNTQGGADTVTLTGTLQATVGNITVNLGGGNDQFDARTATPGTLTAGNVITINAGDGADIIRLGDSSSPTSTAAITAVNTVLQGLDSNPGENPDGGDSFFIRALTTTPYEVEGDDPTLPVGDTLNVDMTGVIGCATVSHGFPNTVVTFNSGQLPITYREIETFVSSAGCTNNIFDLNNFPTGDVLDVLLLDANTLQVQLEGVPVFTGPDDTVNSLTFAGRLNTPDAVRVHGMAVTGAMPTEAGGLDGMTSFLPGPVNYPLPTVDGVRKSVTSTFTNYGRSVPNGSSPPAFYYDGRGGGDAFVLDLPTARDVAYLTDSAYTGAADISVQATGGAFIGFTATVRNLSSVNLQEQTASGSSLLIDASSTAAPIWRPIPWPSPERRRSAAMAALPKGGSPTSLRSRFAAAAAVKRWTWCRSIRWACRPCSSTATTRPITTLPTTRSASKACRGRLRPRCLVAPGTMRSSSPRAFCQRSAQRQSRTISWGRSPSMAKPAARPAIATR
jgi:hypothetical protein